MICHDITIEDYHASDFVSKSKLMTLDELGPFGYRARHLTGENKRESTEAQWFGQAFEVAVQDPAAFAQRYQEMPVFDLKGKADADLIAEAGLLGLTADEGKPYSRHHDAKTVHAAIYADGMKRKGVEVITRKDMIRIERMVQSFDRNTQACGIVAGAMKQVTLRNDYGGLDFIPGTQSRPDWYFDHGDSVDLKAIARFTRADKVIEELGYHSQAAMIDECSGLRSKRSLIACENEWPFRCQVIDLDTDWLAIGAAWVNERLAVLRDCYARDEWPLCDERRTSKPPRYLAERYGL